MNSSVGKTRGTGEGATAMEPKPSVLSNDAIIRPCIDPEMQHEFQIVESFFKDEGRTKRTYPAVCRYCLLHTHVEITIPE